LPIEIPAVVSNHSDLKALVESHGIKFIYQSKLSLVFNNNSIKICAYFYVLEFYPCGIIS